MNVCLYVTARFRALAPRQAMSSKWHSIETKLTELYGLQDWQGKLLFLRYWTEYLTDANTKT